MKQGSNNKVLELLYKDIFPKVKLHILKNSGSEDDALDIFQDSMVILCKMIKEGKYNTKFELHGFIFSVCKNLWINKVKKEKREVALDNDKVFVYEHNFSDYILTREKEKGLRDITLLLGTKCMELLKHSVFYKTPPKDILEEMGFTSINAIKTQKYKCKQKLFTILKDNPKLHEVLD